MSKENVEVGEPVRRLWGALSKREWDAFSAELDPDVEYAPAEEHVVSRSREAVIQYVERWLQAWETFSGEVEEVVSAPCICRHAPPGEG